jgi:hypothetical protein
MDSSRAHHVSLLAAGVVSLFSKCFSITHQVISYASGPKQNIFFTAFSQAFIPSKLHNTYDYINVLLFNYAFMNLIVYTRHSLRSQMKKLLTTKL